MRKRICLACVAVLGLASSGCLREAAMNPGVAQGRIDGLIDAHRVEAEDWADWWVGTIDDLTGE